MAGGRLGPCRGWALSPWGIAQEVEQLARLAPASRDREFQECSLAGNQPSETARLAPASRDREFQECSLAGNQPSEPGPRMETQRGHRPARRARLGLEQ